MKKGIVVSQGIKIAEFPTLAEAEAYCSKENKNYYKYKQKCLDNGEDYADNECFAYEEDNNIVFVDGDLLSTEADIICHQVNCIGKMGAGLALQIRNQFPDVYPKYVNLCEKYRINPAQLLGGVLFIKTPKYVVANCFAQLGYSRTSCQTDYKALNICLQKVKMFVQRSNTENKCVALPYNMSCGLAGGNWNDVMNIIHSVFDNSGILVKIVKLNM